MSLHLDVNKKKFLKMADLHNNRSRTGFRILGGDFEIKSLKRQIRIFGKYALTDLKICFEQTRPQKATEQPAATANTVTEKIQKFVFPFSDDKNCKFSLSCIFL
jgi:hypothetical protein